KNISFSIKSIATILALLTIINFALGVVQNRTGAESVLNRYAAPNVAITVVETGVRATGTFSFISGLGVMAVVGIWAGLVLLSLRNSTRYRFLGGCSIVAGFGCSLAAVSRGPVLIGAVMVAVWLAFVRLGISSTVRLSIAAALVILMLAVSGLVPILGDLGSGLIQRNESAGDSFQERAFGQFGEMYDAITFA